jgi:hypothetical protein
MPLTKLQFRPGINRDITSYSNEGGWRDGDKVRFRLGYPEKIGGWQKFSTETYLGSARALHNWIALDGSNYLGIGTHLKYYVEEGTSFSDITPLRETITTPGSISFAASQANNFDSDGDLVDDSTIITVTDPSHGCQQNDFVTFVDVDSLGGNVTAAILNTEHQVVRVVDADTYEIVVAVTANASDTGSGGSSVGNFTFSGTGVGTGGINTTGTITPASTSIDTISVSGNGVGVGAILGGATGFRVVSSSVSTGTATFSAVSAAGGSGSGATFDVTADGSGGYSAVLVDGGTGYSPIDILDIAGSNLGGTSPTNNLEIDVISVSGNSYSAVAQSSTSGSGTGATFDITIPSYSSSSGGAYSATVVSDGVGYAASDTITILGTSLGGATTTNDLTITVDSVTHVSAPAGTTTGVTQTSTSGSGTGAEFTITCDGAGNYTIDAVTVAGSGYAASDTITIAGSDLGGTDNITFTVTGLVGATFSNIAQTSTSGSGTGATFDVEVPANTGSASYANVTVNSVGTNYAASDTITIAGTSLGGATPANDLTITLSTIVSNATIEYQINVGLDTTVGGTGWGAGSYGGASGHVPASTALTANLSNVATTIPVTSTTGFPSSGYIVINTEIIQYTGVTATTFTGASRGLFSSTPAAHTSGDAVTEATYGYGMPSSLTTVTQIRLWSHDNFGEDLLINPRDSSIYYWDKSGGAGARAVELSTLAGTKTSVPTICKQVMVSDRDRHVLAFGCDGINSSPSATQGNEIQDPLLIRFSDQEDPLQWYPSATNTAGDLRLGSGSTFVKALETKREILVWTDTAISSLRFIGPPFTFGLQQLANNITIIGPNAAVATEDFVFWMGLDNFYVYAGQTAQLPCTVKDKVFSDINLAEFDKVYGAVNSEFGEVFWLYPSAASSENDRYVVYNYIEKLWYYGTIERTAWLDRGTRDFPIAAYDGLLYNHEFGYDADGQPMNSYIESAAMDIGDGDHFTYIRRVIPDLTFIGSTNISSPQATFTVKARNFPGEDFGNTAAGTAARTSVSPVEEFTNQLDLRIRGRSFALRVESDALESKWKLGSPRVDIRQDGRR